MNELVRFLSHENGFADCLMLRPPVTKIDKSWRMPLIFLAFIILCYTLLVLFIFPLYPVHALIWLNIAVGATACIFWLISGILDPGYIHKPDQLDVLNMMSLVDPVLICPDCMVLRTPRSRHCGTCNHCVERFDHHCPWINNCVGARNHGVFILFLFFMGFTIFFNFIMTIINLYINKSNDDATQLNYIIFKEEVHRNPTAIWISHLVVCVVTGLFFTPLLILIYVHSKNFCTNRTTNERFGGKKYKTTSQSEA